MHNPDPDQHRITPTTGTQGQTLRVALSGTVLVPVAAYPTLEFRYPAASGPLRAGVETVGRPRWIPDLPVAGQPFRPQTNGIYEFEVRIHPNAPVGVYAVWGPRSPRPVGTFTVQRARVTSQPASPSASASGSPAVTAAPLQGSSASTSSSSTASGIVSGVPSIAARILDAEAKILEAVANQAVHSVQDPDWLNAAAHKECCAAEVIKAVASLATSVSVAGGSPALPASTGGVSVPATSGSSATPGSGGGGTTSGGGSALEEESPSGNPPQLSLASKYRRVDIHGVPLPDQSPTGEAESDRPADLGHVDMYSLAPSFSTTDAAAPVEGGELAVEFKRTTGIRSRGVSAVAAKRPITWGSDHILGLGWDTNLGCRIILSTTGSQNVTINVVDEIGNNFSYVPFGTEFRANTYHSFANDAVRARLRKIDPETFELLRVFGTRLIYKKTKQKVNAATMQREEYYLLVNIIDRNGNSLVYEYDQSYLPDRDGDLLVTSIYERAHPERRLSFTYTDKGEDIRTGDKGLRLESVVDPLGTTTNYLYNQQGASPNTVHAMLSEVQRMEVLDASSQPPQPSRPTSKFEYYIERLPTDDAQVQNLFVAPSTIESARGHRTQFSYVTEQFPVAIGRVQVHFQQRPRVATMSTIDGMAVLDTLDRSVEHVLTSATDTSGAFVEYEFLASREPANNELGAAVFVTKLTRRTAGIGQAEFEWAADPNNNLIRVVDMNGEVQKFDYQGHGASDAFADPIDPQRPYNSIENPNRYQAFNLPARRTIVGSAEDLESSWQYETQFNKKIRDVDAEGVPTICHIDSAGNRVKVEQTMGRSRQYTFEPDGFISEQIDEDGRIIRFERLFNPAEVERYVTLRTVIVGYSGPSGGGTLNHVTTSVVDVLGNRRSETDALGHTTTTHYDKLLRVTEIHHPPVEDPNDARGPTVSGIERFTYDLNGNVVSEMDENGNVIRYEYDLLNRNTLTRVRMVDADLDDASDLISKTTYDERGLVDSSTDARGNVTEFEYDDILRKVRDRLPVLQSSGGSPIQHIVHYEYGPHAGAGSFMYSMGWSPTRIINPRGFASDTVFDEFYRAIREVERGDDGAGISSDAPPRAGEPATETRYNKVHKTTFLGIQAEDKFGNDRSKDTYFFYDQGHRNTLEVIDADGGGVGLAIGSVVNDAWSVTLSANSDANRQGYDGASHVIRESDAEGRLTHQVYDGAGRQIEVLEPEVEVFDPAGYNTNGLMRPVHRTSFDARGHVEITEDPNHNRIRMERDARGRIVRTILDMGDGQFNPQAGGPDIVTQIKWDLVGNEIATIDSLGNTVSTQYDRADRPTHTIMPKVDLVGGGTAIPTQITSYDANGNVIDVTDAEGVITHKEYDAWDRCVETTMAYRTPDAVQSETRYDANNNVIEYILHNGNSPQNTRCEYDAYDRKIQEIRPDVNDGLTRKAQTSYFRDGLIAQTTDANGQRMVYSYDRKARVKSLELWRYNGSVEESRKFSYNAVDMTLTVEDGFGKTERSYDALYRLSSEQRSHGSTVRRIEIAHDAAGNPTRQRYPDSGRELITKYDRSSRMIELDDSLSGLTQFEYDANSNRVECQTPNGLQTQYKYDRLNRLKELKAAHTSGSVYSAKFGFDQVGNRLQIEESSAGQSRLLQYEYNELYRLDTEILDQNETRYSYDPAGNRLEVIQDTSGGASTTSCVYDDLNRLMTMEEGSIQTTFSYDLNGNLVGLQRSDGTSAGYAWDVADRLITADVDGDGIDEFHATYDYRSRRELTIESGEKREYHYFESDCIQEFDAQGMVVEFVLGPGLGGGIGGIIYGDRRPSGGTEETYTYNSVGHTMAVTDSTGDVLAAYGYTAFGEHSVLNGASPNDRLANTRQHSKILGLDNHGHRYYDPAVGRYISQDPAGLADGLNLYSYSNNNPINGFDPTGLGGYGIGEWLWDIVTDSSIRNASASGFAEGAKGGGSILVNEYSGGLSDKYGITNSEQYQGAAFDAARVSSAISKEAIMLAGGGGPKLIAKAASLLNKIDKVTDTIQKVDTIKEIGTNVASGNFTGAMAQGATAALGAGLGLVGLKKKKKRGGKRRKDRGTGKTTDTGAERDPAHIEKPMSQDEINLYNQREPDMPGPKAGGLRTKASGRKRGQHTYRHNKKRTGKPQKTNPEDTIIAHSGSGDKMLNDMSISDHNKMTRAENMDPASWDTYVSEGPPFGFAEGVREGIYDKRK